MKLNSDSFGRIAVYGLLAIIVSFLLWRYQTPKEYVPTQQDDINQRLSSKALEYSRHAECRMDCREISKQEVKNAMYAGKYNPAKSQQPDGGCPRFAMEDRTDDGQRIRIIFAACDDKTVVVTAIDLGEDHQCHCN